LKQVDFAFEGFVGDVLPWCECTVMKY